MDDPANKRPLPIIPQMQNNMLTHQHLMQQAALQGTVISRTSLLVILRKPSRAQII
ncbi:hypothetical protein KIN20_007151 [Parelaphostrongylus tenuis]|uniref:Uncharacterized protein n=1 Tax=Parelaphostrongylus tenuis TaxID=148309 RepID=A0AAD5M2W1_PARTN|nr:hypothetical protein KIN20_007151 [Parelaphostrongylus tenuis]